MRIAISVEGLTERDFVTDLLGEHLLPSGIYVTPVIVTTKRVISGPDHKGGDVSVDRAANEIRRLLPNFDFVTTLYDFYGFRGRAQYASPALLESAIRAAVGGATRLRPYVQQYEFEALLFSHPEAVAQYFQVPNADAALSKAVGQFGDPELINLTPDGAPSKRVSAALPQYQKLAHGPTILRRIGLTTIRARCRRFHDWLSWLEHPVLVPAI